MIDSRFKTVTIPEEKLVALEKKVTRLCNLLKKALVWVEYWDSHKPAIMLARRIRKELGKE